MKTPERLPAFPADNPAAKVAIIGAGIGGLAAALFLSKAGYKVTLIERFSTPKPLGSGLMLQQTGMDVLKRLGLLEQVLKVGCRIESFFGEELHQDGKTKKVLDLRFQHLCKNGSVFGLGIQRAALFEILFKAVDDSPIHVMTNTEIKSPDEKALMGYDLLVDASGTRSRLVGACARVTEPRKLPFGALCANLNWPEDQSFKPHVLQQRYRTARQMVGIMPVGTSQQDQKPKAAFFWSLEQKDFETWRTRPLADWKDQVLALWPEMRVFLDQIDAHDDLTFATYQHRTLKKPFAGYVTPSNTPLVHIGDAFHSTSPQLGQGANMALIDAAVLNDSLVKATGLKQGLSLFARTRRWHVKLYQSMSFAFTAMYQSTWRFPVFVRNILVAPTALWPFFRWLNPKIATGYLGLRRRLILPTETDKEVGNECP